MVEEEDALSREEADPAAPSDSGAEDQAVGAAQPAPVGRLRRVGRRVLEVYATVDPRSLGLLRLMLGALLLVDLARRYPDLVDHFTNEGWLTNHFALFQPMSSHLWSLYHAFSTVGEVKLLFWLHFAVNFCFLIGWRTKLMQGLATALLLSISSRNILVENGGYIVLILLTVWSMFLPLGRRFSVDALLGSLRARREATAEGLNDNTLPEKDTRPIVSLAATALLLQWAAIYFFNAVHKNGETWRDGTAVHYFVHQDRMITPFAGMIREHLPLWLIKTMTWGTLVIEFALPVLILTPFLTRRARWVAWALILVLHLSIDLLVQLGPFSWAMMAMLAAFIHRDDWEKFAARQRARREPRVVLFTPGNEFALGVCRLLKRFNGHGLVTFQASERPESGFGVLAGERLLEGRAALLELRRALALPALAFSWLYIPGVAQLFGWLFCRKLAEHQRQARALGVGELPHGIDEVAPPPNGLVRLGRALSHWAAQAVVLVLMVTATSQILIENRAVPESWKPHKRPEWMTALVIYPRMFQGWSMFAPQPPGQDGYIVVDAVTKSGRKVDPFTGGVPTFEMNPKRGYGMNQIWCDFQRRIGEGRFRAYLPGVRDYLLRYHERTGNDEDRIVAFEMWSLTERVPPPGEPVPPPSRHRILQHGSLASPTPWPWPEESRQPPPAPPLKRGRAAPRPPPRSGPARPAPRPPAKP